MKNIHILATIHKNEQYRKSCHYRNG